MAINEQTPVSLKVQNLKQQKPESIIEKLTIGTSDQGYPDDLKHFVGSVTNFILLEDNGTYDITSIVKNLCLQAKAHGILGHTRLEWSLVGKAVIKSEPKEQICKNNLFYQVGVAAPVIFEQSMRTCGLLGSGKMTQIDSDEEANFVVSLFKNSAAICEFIWTPLYDGEEEGQFKNVMTNENVAFLPWKPGAPNGGKDENHVYFEISDKTYSDISTSFRACTACDVSVETSFKLNGFCSDTLMSMNQSRSS